MATLFCLAITASAQSTQPKRQRVRPATQTAQSSPATVAPVCTCPAPAVNSYHPPPYSAKQTSTRVQTLADGTHIQETTVTLIYRNSQGSTRAETLRSVGGDTTRYIHVYDYSTQTQYSWNTGPGTQQTVTVIHPRRNSQPPAVQPIQRYVPYKNESLPPQTIEGIYAQGVHTTRTMPAGYEGNDRDIVTTTENWTAPSLNMQLRSVTDDPRNGKTTVETTDIQQSEPDPSLFQMPAGYQVRDQ